MAEDWDQRDWNEPPPVELPGPLAALQRLPRRVQGGLLLIWWIIAALAYRSVGMSAFPAALVALASLVGLFGCLLLWLWIRRKAWRDIEREDVWRLAGWATIAAAGFFSLPALLFPLIVLSILALYGMIALPLELLR